MAFFNEVNAMSKMSQHHARLCETGEIDPDEYDDSGAPPSPAELVAILRSIVDYCVAYEGTWPVPVELLVPARRLVERAERRSPCCDVCDRPATKDNPLGRSWVTGIETFAHVNGCD